MKHIFTLLLILVFYCADGQSTFTSSLRCEPKQGFNVYGTVECDGRPMQGIQVSDGYEFAETDAEGRYYLSSLKKNGNVFFTAPSGYEYICRKGGFQDFWAKLVSDPETSERHDFRLVKRNQDRFVLFHISDLHMCRPHGVSQLKKIVFPEIKKKAAQYDIPVYTINTGDTQFDKLAYECDFHIADARKVFEETAYPTPMFAVMGNHDNDSAVPAGPDTDFKAETKYRNAFGPTYYSFNIGKFHFVMFDDIKYLNEPGRKVAVGAAGKRNYHHHVTENQIEWIRKDLEKVDVSTPIIICSHCPIYHLSGMSATKTIHKFPDRNNWTRFVNLFRERQFTMLSGHTHRLEVFAVDSVNFRNITAPGMISHRWETAAGINPKHHYSSDACPIGFGIIEADGDRLNWRFNSIAYGEDKQFFVWDLNEVRKYCRHSSRYRDFISHYSDTWTDFTSLPDNQLAIQIWAWEPTWKIRVTENGKEIEVKRKIFESPEYVFYDDIHNTTDRGHYSKGRAHSVSRHIFIAQCSEERSKVTVEVTDSFGRVYTRTFSRPLKYAPDRL